jgi:DNA-binding transcriptional ArsR family regulator
MPETVPRSRARTDTELSRNDAGTATGPNDPVDSDGLLWMLSDEYARDIVKEISEDPLPARDIADSLDLSRPTVYRRLNRLEEFGIVQTSLSLDPDGHHRQQFRSTLEEVVVSIDAGQIDVDLAA